LIQQHKFHETRQWRFDFAFVDLKIAIEIQGIGPGHNSIPAMKNDYEKGNEALRYGWITIYLMGYQLEPDTINSTIDYILQIIKDRQNKSITKNQQEPKQKFSSLIAHARSRLLP